MPWVYVLMPVRVRIDRRADDGVGNVEMPTHETARDMYHAGGGYPDIQSATTVLLENVPHAPLIKSTGLATNERPYALPWCSHHPKHIIPAMCADRAPTELEEAQKKLSDAELVVARVAQEVADSSKHHEDKGGETYLVGVEEMTELKKAIKEWKVATADFLLAAQKIST